MRRSPYAYDKRGNRLAETGKKASQSFVYDATNRTWLAMDPVKDGLNWYEYCGSNPTTNMDPTGLSFFSAFTKLAGSAASSGVGSIIDQKAAGGKINWGTVALGSLTGGVIGSLSGAVGGVAAQKAAGAFDHFCGRAVSSVVGQVAKKWTVGTVAQGITGTVTTFAANLLETGNLNQSIANTKDNLGQIWGNAVFTNTVAVTAEALTTPLCFVAGTMVATSTGLIAIESIQAGDMVLAENEATGEVAYKEVVRTFINSSDEIAHVTIRTEAGVVETIDATPQHPFYVEGKGWVEANALHAGMIVWLADGTKATVEDISVEALDEPVLVYNFEVKDFHTYFVGSSNVLVHNKCDVTWPNKDHTNKTEGHWPTIQETAKQAAQADDAKAVYVNKGLSNVIDNPPHNNRPDVMILHNDGTIDLVEVASKTDSLNKLIERMATNASYIGEKVGSMIIKTAQGNIIWQN